MSVKTAKIWKILEKAVEFEKMKNNCWKFKNKVWKFKNNCKNSLNSQNINYMNIFYIILIS